MINVAVYSDGIYEAVGVPSIFLDNSNFVRLLSEKSVRDDVIKLFGNGVCVGRLGVCVDGVYEDEQTCSLPENCGEEGDLGYFEGLLSINEDLERSSFLRVR